MRGEKQDHSSYPDAKWTTKSDWPWVNPTYKLELPTSVSFIKRMEIDPSQRMADVNRSNNTYKPKTSQPDSSNSSK